MSLNQYVYFAIASVGTTADEITQLLGVEPDEVTVRGSTATSPHVIPFCHVWKVVCREPGLPVDEQIGQVIGRLRPRMEALTDLTARLAAEEGPGGTILQVERFFNRRDERPSGSPDDTNLFGWRLDRAVVNFLAATGADLDVGEYDMMPSDD
ncbi:DUF4279 domain-containing protein [Kitasatospora purpeofusca]|uniref:DUF4279 domain-containing protein n=1 Tax=Kitasatospora purpeofusca TaxID=67352 RepID=UPI0022512DE0|nr:DUF4279 domain-containing protein [Kitasatospora purpeofusca]MCX4755396.1 DUF4279 domain-containing protein [Kitasatospora purpeofusca]WSR36730.1 DUF4279 domain-containing protein [Kitasatospora purpeofusca]WSR45012.1 DUF4279 domain-containing protein [Kitasatospora purpeofusca]